MKAMVLMVLQMAMHAATLVIIAKPEYGTCSSDQSSSEWKDMLHALGSAQRVTANAMCVCVADTLWQPLCKHKLLQHIACC